MGTAVGVALTNPRVRGTGLGLLRLLPLLLFVPLLCLALSQEPFLFDTEEDEVAEPATFRRASHPLPYVQEKTLFLIANEPVLESHIVSNLLHQLLYTLKVPNERVVLMDEHLLSGHAKTNYATLLPWLLQVHQNLEPGIQFVWLGTAHSRVVGESLNTLMRILSEESQGDGNQQEENRGARVEWYPDGLCVGMSLRDETPAIIHHFHRDDAFVYPLIDAGLLMDRRFLEFVSNTVKEEGRQKLFPPKIEIDPVHELFRFLYESRRFLMQHSDLFCPYTPIPTDFDRAETPYPPPHTRRPAKTATGPGRKNSGPQTVALSGKDKGEDAGEESDKDGAFRRQQTSRSPGLRKAENEIEGCVSFTVGCRHSPILSHQFFDRLIEYEQDIMEKKDALAEQYPVNVDLDRQSDFHKLEEALLNERPFFIVEPEDVFIAVKTHPGNLRTRVPLLKQLWASPDAVVEMAQRRSNTGRNSHAFRSAILQEEQANLEEHMRNIAIQFFSEKAETADQKGPIAPGEGQDRLGKRADGSNLVEIPVSSPGKKRALCQKMKGILDHFFKNHKTRKFLVIVDDDTLVNVRHLLDAISMSLQAPVPARVFFRAALTNHNGLRLAHQPYKQLAEEIDKYMWPWKKHYGAAETEEYRSQREKEHDDDRKTRSEKKADALRQKDRETASLLNAFAASAYSKNRKQRSESSRNDASRMDRVSPLYLGQRYSFGHTALYGPVDTAVQGKGYDYITSGGGVVLDREAVEGILNCKECVCPEDGTADDMLLGLWMHRLKVPALHARWFHQERPKDYHPIHIKMTTPVSFHRLEQDAYDSKKIFDRYVDVGDGLNVGADEDDDFEALDWIDLDWEQTEDTLWNDRDDGSAGFETDDDQGVDFPSIVRKAMAEAEEQGKKNMSPADIADHLEEQIKKQHRQEEKERNSHGHGDEL